MKEVCTWRLPNLLKYLPNRRRSHTKCEADFKDRSDVINNRKVFHIYSGIQFQVRTENKAFQNIFSNKKRKQLEIEPAEGGSLPKLLCPEKYFPGTEFILQFER